MYHISPVCCPMNNTTMAKNETSVSEAIHLNGSDQPSNVMEKPSVHSEPTTNQPKNSVKRMDEETPSSTEEQQTKKKPTLKVSEVQTDAKEINYLKTNGEISSKESSQIEQSNNVICLHDEQSKNISVALKNDTNGSIGLLSSTEQNSSGNVATVLSADSAYASISVGDASDKMPSDAETNNLHKDKADSNVKMVTFEKLSSSVDNNNDDTIKSSTETDANTAKGGLFASNKLTEALFIG